MEHGKVTGGGRWCSVHGYFHGLLYPCGHYSIETLSEIAELDAVARTNWSDPQFIKRQIDDGMPIDGVYIMQMFAGLR